MNEEQEKMLMLFISLLVRQSQGEDVDDELNKALGIFEKNTGFKFKREQGDCLYHTI